MLRALMINISERGRRRDLRSVWWPNLLRVQKSPEKANYDSPLFQWPFCYWQKMWREVVQLVMALGVHQSGLSVPDRQSRWLSGPGWSIAEGGAGVCHGSSEIPDSAGSGFSPCRQVQRDHKYSLIDGGIIFGSHSEWNNPPALNCLKEVRGHLGEKHD